MAFYCQSLGDLARKTKYKRSKMGPGNGTATEYNVSFQSSSVDNKVKTDGRTPF